MHIQLSAKIRTMSADMVQGVAKIGIRAKLNEVDPDVIDRLSELCTDELGVHAFLQATGREPINMDCWIASVKGDFAAHALLIILQSHKSALPREAEETLVEWCRMEREALVEVSSWQMSFKDLPKGVDSVTLTAHGKTAVLK